MKKSFCKSLAILVFCLLVLLHVIKLGAALAIPALLSCYLIGNNAIGFLVGSFLSLTSLVVVGSRPSIVHDFMAQGDDLDYLD